MFTLFGESPARAAAAPSILPCRPRNTAMKDAAIWASGDTNGKSGWKSVRIWSARPAAKPLRPNAPMQYIAAMPVDRKRTDKMLRIVPSDHFDHLVLSVTPTAENESQPLRLVASGHFVLLLLSVTKATEIKNTLLRLVVRGKNYLLPPSAMKTHHSTVTIAGKSSF